MNSELTKLNSELIKFKSTSDRPEELKKIVDFVEDYFSGSDVVVKRYESNKKPSIVVLLEDTKSPKLFLVAHLDVVPAEDSQFEPRVEGDMLYGRGSIDNKGSAAIIISLMKHYSQQDEKPDIGLMLTTDEEIGGKDGARYLVEDEGYSCEFAIVPDGGNDYEVVIKEKGLLHVRIKAKGQGAHGSKQWLGENALDRLIEIYHELRKEFPFTTEEDRWKQTLNLGVMHGGTAANKVAEQAEMELDMRFTSDQEKKRIKDYILNIEGVEVDIMSEGSLFDTDENNPYLHKLKSSVEKIIGRKINFSKEHGASDARHLADANIPSALLEPIGGNIHADEEFVVISSMETVYNILKDFVDENF